VDQTDIAIIGAGPHGLAAAAHLRRAGVECRVHGRPMSFWRGNMPKGMLLRSNWTATCIAEYEGPLSLDSFCAATGTAVQTPVPRDRFIEYGTWVQAQVAPDVDERLIARVEKNGAGFVVSRDDGSQLHARRVVVAAGIAPFLSLPGVGAQLPKHLASHTIAHRDFSAFSGSSVLVVGGGQSALESAALLNESGAKVSVIARQHKLNWLHGGKYHRMLGRFSTLVYAPTDVGPMGISRIVAVPGLFRRLPRQVQDPMAARAIRPAGAAWLRPRLADVPLRTGRWVVDARPHGDRVRVELDDGTFHLIDHLLFGTGFRIDVARYDFLPTELVSRVKQVNGYPLLRHGMESSVPGLHFIGAPAARSFGPIMRFVAGGWYGAASLTRVVAAGAAHHEPRARALARQGV
jgi:hypothetical protein